MELYGPLVEEGQHLLADVSERDLRTMGRFLQGITELTERHRGRVDPMR
jgi:hypothetical protein